MNRGTDGKRTQHLQATDSFSALAEITQSSAIVGERLRFSKGLYLIGATAPRRSMSAGQSDQHAIPDEPALVPAEEPNADPQHGLDRHEALARGAGTITDIGRTNSFIKCLDFRAHIYATARHED